MFNEDIVKIALPKIEPGLKKYQAIMSRLHDTEVSKDKEFQRMYNGFYRVRQRNADFYNTYYEYMECMKNGDVSFENTILYLYRGLGRIEPSFSSKLIATIDDELPVWDEHVLNNLNLKPPAYASGSEEAKLRRINKIIKLYSRIQAWYSDVLLNEETHEAISLFDDYYPENNISQVKKIDLILWQSR